MREVKKATHTSEFIIRIVRSPWRPSSVTPWFNDAMSQSPNALLLPPERPHLILPRLAVTLGRQGASNVLLCYTLDSEGVVGPALKELSR